MRPDLVSHLTSLERARQVGALRVVVGRGVMTVAGADCLEPVPTKRPSRRWVRWPRAAPLPPPPTPLTKPKQTPEQRRAYRHQYYLANRRRLLDDCLARQKAKRAEISQAQRERRVGAREEYNRKQQEYRARTRVRQNEYNQSYRERNREKVRAYMRAYYYRVEAAKRKAKRAVLRSTVSTSTLAVQSSIPGTTTGGK